MTDLAGRIVAVVRENGPMPIQGLYARLADVEAKRVQSRAFNMALRQRGIRFTGEIATITDGRGRVKPSRMVEVV